MRPRLLELYTVRLRWAYTPAASVFLSWLIVMNTGHTMSMERPGVGCPKPTPGTNMPSCVLGGGLRRASLPTAASSTAVPHRRHRRWMAVVELGVASQSRRHRR